MAFNEFMGRIFGGQDKTAKAVAKDRLRVVLMHDRAAIPAPVMEEMRRELLAVIAKYVEIDGATMTLEHDGDDVALVANVPIRRAGSATPAAPRRAV